MIPCVIREYHTCRSIYVKSVCYRSVSIVKTAIHICLCSEINSIVWRIDDFEIINSWLVAVVVCNTDSLLLITVKYYSMSSCRIKTVICSSRYLRQIPADFKRSCCEQAVMWYGRLHYETSIDFYKVGFFCHIQRSCACRVASVIKPLDSVIALYF